MPKILDYDKFCESLPEITSTKIIGKKKFHPEGLFSEQIFGPVKNYTCQCDDGTYWGPSRSGTICSKCGVPITKSEERRKRFAKIVLPIKVVNPIMYDLLISMAGKNFKKALDDLMKNEKSCLYFEKDEFVITNEDRVPKDVTKYERSEAIYKLVHDYAKQMVEEGDEEWKIILNNINSLLIDKIIVLPPDLRPTSKTGADNKQLMDTINRNYLKLLLKKEIMKQTIIDIYRNKSLYYSYFRQLQNEVNQIYTVVLEKLSKKEGLIRGNILGKRIDFSGRAVIVPDPTLNIDECKIPYIMALEIFKLQIAKKILSLGKIKFLNQAIDFIDECIDKNSEVLVPICEEVIKDEVCILNRQPSLHRLGMLGFKLKITLDNVIKIHPMVCHPFNADFDGDQMAVYVPISEQAKQEIREKMLVTKNFNSPANDNLTTIPNQDIVLGIYYITTHNKEGEKKVKYKGESIPESLVELNECFPPDFPVIKESINAKKLIEMLTYIKDNYPENVTANVLDSVKKLGFKYSTLTGFTMSVDDLYIKKAKEIKDFIYNNKNVLQQLAELNKPVIADFLKKNFKYASFIESGARGSWDQLKQLVLSRGFVSNFEGQILPIPIKGSLVEGLTEEEFFYSTYGSRKGLLDVALNTGASGYLSRKLIFTCANLQLGEEQDCGTTDLLEVYVNTQRKAKMLVGRYMLSDKKTLTMITKENCLELVDKTIKIRSPILCKTPKICRTCYGDLANRINTRFIGIVAAQTLGERGTQLVLRTFHTSGSAIIKNADGQGQSDHQPMKQEDIIGDLASVSELLHDFSDKTYTEIVAELFQAYDKDIYHVHFECVVAQLMWANGTKWRLIPNRDKVQPKYFSVQSVPSQESWILALAFSNPKRSILNGIRNEGKYYGIMDKILKGELLE